jgi:hypothetical protein
MLVDIYMADKVILTLLQELPGFHFTPEEDARGRSFGIWENRWAFE